MGDPKKVKKKYSGPRHPWIKENIELDKELLKEYALKNKKEIHKMDSFLKNFKDRAKKLIAAKTKQSEKEKKQLMQYLQKYGLIPAEATLDQVLGLTIRNIMDRRLQSLVYKKALAKTMSQARQFIVHNHILVGNKVITSPRYIVNLAEEDQIRFVPKSPFASPDHPERIEQMPAPKPEKKEEKPTEKKEEKKKETKPSSKSEKGLEKPGVSPKPKKATKKKEAPTKEKKAESKEEKTKEK
jgi:small subunit ribosomal protein S4